MEVPVAMYLSRSLFWPLSMVNVGDAKRRHFLFYNWIRRRQDNEELAPRIRIQGWNNNSNNHMKCSIVLLFQRAPVPNNNRNNPREENQEQHRHQFPPQENRPRVLFRPRGRRLRQKRHCRPLEIMEELQGHPNNNNRHHHNRGKE